MLMIVWSDPSWEKSSSDKVAAVEQRVWVSGCRLLQPISPAIFLTVSVADQTVVCACAGVVANSERAPTSSARTGRRERRGRKRPKHVSVLRWESADVEGAGLRAPARRRAHVMAAGPLLGRWAAGPLGVCLKRRRGSSLDPFAPGDPHSRSGGAGVRGILHSLCNLLFHA